MANDILTEKIPEKNTKEEAIITEITKQPEISKTQTSIFEIFLILASILLAIFLILFISFTIINVKSKKINCLHKRTKIVFYKKTNLIIAAFIF